MAAVIADQRIEHGIPRSVSCQAKDCGSMVRSSSSREAKATRPAPWTGIPATRRVVFRHAVADQGRPPAAHHAAAGEYWT